jgi:hypothetical protein
MHQQTQAGHYFLLCRAKVQSGQRHREMEPLLRRHIPDTFGRSLLPPIGR